MRQSPIYRLRVVSFAGVVLLCTVSAFGQTGQLTMAPTAGREQEGQAVRRLTVEEAVKLAVDQNLGVQIQRLDPQIQDEAVAQARAAWLPNLTSSFSKNSNNTPSTSSLS